MARTLASIRAGGDLVVTVELDTSDVGRSVAVVRMYDTDGGYIDDVAAFDSYERNTLLPPLLPMLVDLARQRQSALPGCAEGENNTAWLSTDENGRLEWAGTYHENKLPNDIGAYEYESNEPNPESIGATA